MSKQKNAPGPFASISTSRRWLLKTTAYAAPGFMAGAALPLLPGCNDSTSYQSDEDVINFGAREAVERIQKGEIRVEDYVARLIGNQEIHRELNAFITIDQARILEEARAVDQARSKGERLKTLSGLPFVVKDQIDVAGYPTTAGNAALKAYIPTRSAAVVSSLVEAGGIMFGKTNLPDMAAGGNLMAAAASNNRFFGRVRNPYDPTRIPGGSSGGTGAAIGARIVPAGIGEDTGGSVRFPAAYCGIAGLRPSTYTTDNALSRAKPKRYSDHGIVPPPGFRETFGPMARTIADCAFLDTVITGDKVPQVTLHEVRIGMPRPDYWENEFVDHGVAQVMLEAFAKLRDAGATLVEIDFEGIVNSAGDSLDAALRQLEDPVSLAEWLAQNLPGVTLEDVYSDGAIPAGRQLPELSDAERIEIVSTAAHRYADAFKSTGIVAIAFPTIPIPPSPINLSGETLGQMTMVNGKLINEIDAIVKNIFWGSRLGAPGLNIPAGLTRGLPVGFGVEGLPGDDSRLLGLGIEIEDVLGPIAPPTLATS